MAEFLVVVVVSQILVLLFVLYFTAFRLNSWIEKQKSKYLDEEDFEFLALRNSIEELKEITDALEIAEVNINGETELRPPRLFVYKGSQSAASNIATIARTSSF